MADDKVKRRLTTVLCADAQGYSRLMEADEAGTLGTLRR
jgi:adenylate cyclase